MKHTFILGLLALPLLWSCIDDIDAGPTVTQERNLQDYSELAVNGSFEVVISPDYNFDLRITAPDNLLPYIDTYTVGDRLIIEEEKNRIKHRSILIEISETALSKLDLNGSGSITTQDTLESESIHIQLNGSGEIDILLSCNELSLSIDGSGKIQTLGMAERVFSRIDGSGDINSRNIQSVEGDARINGSGNIDIHASDTFYARVGGSGTIRYWGEPTQVDALVNGSGKIIRVD